MVVETLSQDVWFSILKPYQRKYIEQLVQTYGEEKTAEIWLTSGGALQTARFGGENDSLGDRKDYWRRFKIEFDKFICGHPDYSEVRNKVSQQAGSIGLIAIPIISSEIAASVGISHVIIVPAVVLLLNVASKVGVRAYCANKRFADDGGADQLDTR